VRPFLWFLSRPELQPGSQFGAFLDGSLGIQFAGQLCAPNYVETFVSNFSLAVGGQQIFYRLLPSAQNDIIDIQNLFFIPNADMQTKIINSSHIQRHPTFSLDDAAGQDGVPIL
jgi:hypothetical protein